VKERAKELQVLKKKYKKWGKEDEKRIKEAFVVLVEGELECVKSLEISNELVNDFRASAYSLLSSRMHYDKVAENACIYIPVPRTIYYKFVHPQLKNVRNWMAHIGDWSQPHYRHRILSNLDSISELRLLFGDAFVTPLQTAEICGYNSNVNKGDLNGFVSILNYNNDFKFSYNHNAQRLKFTFSYLSYRWAMGENSEKKLQLWNGDEDKNGVHTPGYPVIGHQVKIFWKSFGTWHAATVRRWSRKKLQWQWQKICSKNGKSCLTHAKPKQNCMRNCKDKVCFIYSGY